MQRRRQERVDGSTVLNPETWPCAAWPFRVSGFELHVPPPDEGAHGRSILAEPNAGTGSVHVAHGKTGSTATYAEQGRAGQKKQRRH